MKEVVLLTNILTPYRRYFYDLLKEEFQNNGISFHVLLMAAGEPNRPWNYEDLKTDYTILLKGHTITLKKYYRYVQFNTGLAKVLDSLRPDLLVCGGSYLSRTVQNAASYCHKHSIPVWFWNESTLQEQTNSSLVSAVLERIRRHTLSQYDGFWTAGRLAGEFVHHYTNQNVPLIRVPNLIDPKLYAETYTAEEISDLREKYGLGKDSLILFTPARLSEDKGLLQFLELLKQCAPARLEWVIAGEGPLREKLEEAGKKIPFTLNLLGSKKAEEAFEKEEAPAEKKPFVRQDPRSLMDELNMEDEDRYDSDEADDYEKDEEPRKKVAKKPPYDDGGQKKGISSENLRFWIFTAIVALLVIAAVLFILWKRGIIFHGDDSTTQAPPVQTTEATRPSDTLPPETTTAVDDETTTAEPTTTEVPEEVREVLKHYEKLFVVRDKVGDNEVHMLNIREKADPQARVIAQIARYGGGEIVEAGAEWTKISSGGFTGFVKSEYIATGEEAEAMALEHADKYVRVTSENGLRIRQSASATGDPVMVAQYGAIMIYEGEENGFYHINYADQFDGFVSMDFSEYDWYLMGAIPNGE